MKNKASDRSFPRRILRGILVAAVIFCLCMLLVPLLLLQSDDPAAFVTVASVAVVAATAFSAGFACAKGGDKGALLYGLVPALILASLFALTSLIFGSKGQSADPVFAAAVYGSIFVFALLGSALGKKQKRRKRAGK